MKASMMPDKGDPHRRPDKVVSTPSSQGPIKALRPRNIKVERRKVEVGRKKPKSH
jgi:hypothetical protein